MPAALKSLVLLAFAGLVLAFGTAAPASADTPCWKALINDWFDGHIDRTYPPACYTQAINHLPRDVRWYSSAKDDILAALHASLRNDGPPPPSSAVKRTTAGASPSTSSNNEKSQKGVVQRAVEWLGPSDAASVPLPLLVLAGAAFLLLAAACGSLVNRRLRARRLPPPQA